MRREKRQKRRDSTKYSYRVFRKSQKPLDEVVFGLGKHPRIIKQKGDKIAKQTTNITILELLKLQEPFPVSDIEWRLGSINADANGGMALAYLTNRAIQERLDNVLGPQNWKNEFEKWDTKGVKCGISIKIENEWVTKYDGADEPNIEPTKGGFSDSMKRAAVQWGMGRYLYEIPSVWVPLTGGKIAKETVVDLQKRYGAYIKKKFKKQSA